MDTQYKQIEPWNLLNAFYIHRKFDLIATFGLGNDHLKFAPAKVTEEADLDVLYVHEPDELDLSELKQFIHNDGYLVVNITGKDFEEADAEVFGSRGVNIGILEHENSKYLIYTYARKAFRTITWEDFKTDYLNL